MFRLQAFAATIAIIEELASISRHHFDSLMAALWTGNCGVNLH